MRLSCCGLSVARASAPFVFVLLAGMFPARELRAQASVPVDSFARYELPDNCAMHAVRLERQFWRDKRPDTLSRAKWGSPLQRYTVESVRQCVTRFTLTTVPVRHLLFLGQAYLAANEDVRADSAFQRLIAASASQSLDERAWTMGQIVTAYVQASPVRVERAVRTAAALDQLGPKAAVARMLAHLAIARVASMADSMPLYGEQARAAVAAGTQMVGNDRKQRVADEYAARSALVDWYARRAVFDSARIAARATNADISRYPDEFDWIVQRYDKMGTPAPALERTWTFNNPDSATYPIAGKPTLLVFTWAGCREDCYAGYAPLRRLVAKYASAGLRVFIPTKTWGYFGEQLMAPKEEAEKIRWYFMEYLKLPAAIDVRNEEFTFRDDGMRQGKVPPALRFYWNLGLPMPTPQVVLIDRAGNVRMASALSVDTELRYDNLLAEMK